MNLNNCSKLRHTAFTAVSYGAFLLLIMPINIMGIAGAAVCFTLGICFLWTKPLKIENDFWVPLLISVPVLGYLGNYFYNSWLPSSAIAAIASVMHLPSDTLIAAAAAVLCICAGYFTTLMIQGAMKRFATKNEKVFFSRDVLCCLVAAAVTVALAQLMIRVDILSMGIINFYWGVALVSVVILFFYCVTGRIEISVSLGTVPFMVISTINVCEIANFDVSLLFICSDNRTNSVKKWVQPEAVHYL